MSRETTGSGNKLVVSNPAQVADLTAFTYSCWVYPKNSIGLGTTSPRLISKMFDASTERKRFSAGSVSAGKRLIGSVSRATTNALASSVANILVVDTWAHVAMTYDETNGVRLYKDGVEQSYTSNTVGSGSTLADSGGDLVFFNIGTAANTLDGRLAEIGIWNRVLTGSELTVLAGRMYTPRLVSAGLLGAWRLLGDSSPEPDSIHGNSAAVTGAIQAADPPGIIIALPERATRLGQHRGELLRMG